MKTAPDKITYQALGYNENLSRGVGGRRGTASPVGFASGDLDGFYPRPTINWSNAPGITTSIEFTDGSANTHTVTLTAGIVTGWDVVEP